MLNYTDAFGLLFSERLNIEVLLLATGDGDAYINLRARPWKNSAKDGYMLLVGAFTFEECLIALADCFNSGYWQRLSWTMRVGPGYSPPTETKQYPTTSHFAPQEKPQEHKFRVLRTEDTEDPAF